ncbi:hypothetical protein C8J57DRAFT_1091594 [Mycena rebaudengoi]|nr:hypothetical protein C8J57DRAFT_1091594 [Mycena rebaudengoi]
MTAYKAQGKTLKKAIVNLATCKGTEAPYVMLSRVASLEGLIILTPFDKARICCRRSQDLRQEFLKQEIWA